MHYAFRVWMSKLDTFTYSVLPTAMICPSMCIVNALRSQSPDRVMLIIIALTGPLCASPFAGGHRSAWTEWSSYECFPAYQWYCGTAWRASVYSPVAQRGFTNVLSQTSCRADCSWSSSSSSSTIHSRILAATYSVAEWQDPHHDASANQLTGKCHSGIQLQCCASDQQLQQSSVRAATVYRSPRR